MNVLVIPEDFRKDQYILKPLVEAMMKARGKVAKVRVCQDPRLGGIDQALNWEQLAEIIDRYSYRVELFLLCVDRDGNPTRRQRLDQLEQEAASMLYGGKQFLAENAWQEIEVWILAGHELPGDWGWQEIREEVNPKERYFLPFAQQRGLLDEPGEGRKTLAKEAAGRYVRIRQLCPEVDTLEQRIQ